MAPPPPPPLRDPGAFCGGREGGEVSRPYLWAPPPNRYHSAPLFGGSSTEGSPSYSFPPSFLPPGLDPAWAPSTASLLPPPPPPLQAVAPCCGAQNGVGSRPPANFGSVYGGFVGRATGRGTQSGSGLAARSQSGHGEEGQPAWALSAPALWGRRTRGIREDITQGLELTSPSQGLSAASHQAGLLQPKLAQAKAVAWVSASMAALGLVLWGHSPGAHTGPSAGLNPLPSLTPSLALAAWAEP